MDGVKGWGWVWGRSVVLWCGRRPLAPRCNIADGHPAVSWQTLRHYSAPVHVSENSTGAHYDDEDKQTQNEWVQGASKHMPTTSSFARRSKSTAPVWVYAKLDIFRQPRRVPEPSLSKRGLPPPLPFRNNPHFAIFFGGVLPPHT